MRASITPSMVASSSSSARKLNTRWRICGLFPRSMIWRSCASSISPAGGVGSNKLKVLRDLAEAEWQSYLETMQENRESDFVSVKARNLCNLVDRAQTGYHKWAISELAKSVLEESG